MTVNNKIRKSCASKKPYTRQQLTLMGLPTIRPESYDNALWGRGLSPEVRARVLRDEYRAARALTSDQAEIIVLHKRLDHLLRRVWREAEANRSAPHNSGVKKVYK